MSKIPGFLLAAALCIGMLGAGAAQEPAGGNSSSGAQNVTGPQRMQDRISREVYHELVMLPQLTIFDNIQYKVDGNKVTLMGQVRDAILKDSAEKTVKHIEGVDSVNNQIEILPASGNDDRIRREVARALFNDERLFHYSMGSVPPIHIIVKGGHVTLEGVVNSEADKNEANIRANSVPGVFSVDNHLQVQKS
ncbi:MAG TPA: BON domain-containing protein [Candidatus Angelobacter sp.]|nr:BON domain-containing protein [Candidatus Angelobacter sp.]